MPITNKYEIDLAVLVDRLDVLMDETDAVSDFKTTATIALDFCYLLVDFLDAKQKRAVENARAFWNGDDVVGHRNSVTEFAEIISEDKRVGADKRQATLNRLVWVALNTNTEFSAYAGEFILGLAADAGLKIDQMREVLSRNVPNF